MYYESPSKHYPLTSTYFFSLTIHLAKHGFIVILWNGVYILKCSTSSCFRSSLTRYSITGFNQKLQGARYGLYGGKVLIPCVPMILSSRQTCEQLHYHATSGYPGYQCSDGHCCNVSRPLAELWWHTMVQ
jgi:hypothetical protein